MFRSFFVALLPIFSAGIASAQQVLLLTEDFEQPSNTFAFDTGNALGGTAGNNQWIINNLFDGGGIYPNTTNQDSTNTGTITNSPFSTYLHIHDVNATGGIANANFNPASVSDRFAYTSDGFCTLGMKDILLAFFYLCEGNSNAYGEVYYSLDGGPWLQAGAARYSNQSKWEYVTITNPAFDNVSNLRFGFRWVNGSSAPPGTISFSLDDIIVVGTYDQITGPQINIDQVSPNPVCRNNALVLFWSMTAPLCDGTYQIELSNAGGNFTNPTSLGVFGIVDQQVSGAVAVVIDGSVPPNGCYRVRLNRLSPHPAITGNASVCFTVQTCPNTITTLTPIVTIDPDTVCSRSAIDVPFISRGVYNANNVYIAQLSDSSGSFANPQTIGTFPSRETYDPAIGAMPGNVSGLIPITPEGCNYLIRVVSTSPSVIGTTYGPFCIKHCDITTNQTIDLQFCIKETTGESDTVLIDINEWNTTADYLAGNRFIVQLLDMMTLNVINEGGLGIVFDTASTSFVLTVPGLNALLALGIQPGAYYMRIIADNSTTPWNSNGTIIRITIGAPADFLTIVPAQTFYCNTEVASLSIVPYNPDSQYEWLSTALNNGVPFEWPFNPLLVNFDGADPGPYSFRVRETNFGCTGNYSPLATIYIITIPDVNIAGPTTVCQGDTFLYNVTFLPETYYQWTLQWGTIVDTSNNEIIVTFDSVGTTQLSLNALNNCGERSNTYTVNVVQTLSVEAGDDETICAGDSVRLEASGAGFDKKLTTTLLGTLSNNGYMFDLRAIDQLTVTGFEARLTAGDTVDAEIYYRPATYTGNETDPSSWARLGGATGIIAAATGTTLLPIPINITIPAGTDYGFYITTTNAKNLRGTAGTSVGNEYTSDGILSFIEGAGVDFAFSSPSAPRVWNGTINYFTESGVSYLWSNSANTKGTTVKPLSDTNYTVEVTDTNNCNARDNVSVFVNQLPEVTVGRDDTLLCKGESLQLNASGAHVYQWSPGEGLSATDIPNPTVLTLQTTPYVLQGIDTTTGCINYDTLVLSIEGCDVLIKIPQAFTPDGDNVNDFFSVFGENLERYEIRIFNRWGEQVYYSTDLNTLCQSYPCNQGWDGTHKGKVQDMGVYVYYIKAGKGTDAPIERKGNVTLVR